MHPYAAKRIWFALARTAEDAYVHWADDVDLDFVILLTEMNKIWLMTFVLRLVQGTRVTVTEHITQQQNKKQKKYDCIHFLEEGVYRVY